VEGLRQNTSGDPEFWHTDLMPPSEVGDGHGRSRCDAASSERDQIMSPIGANPLHLLSIRMYSFIQAVKHFMENREIVYE